jgi:hypothetical protein
MSNIYLNKAHRATCSNSLPFAVFDEEHGWGIVTRPPKRLPRYATEHARWHMLQFADGVMCRSNRPGEGFNRFFSWGAIVDYVRDYEAARARYRHKRERRPVWRLLYRMWG